MTTSGTTSFSVSRDDLIKGALRKIGVVAQGEVPTADQYTEAAFALNLLVKAWQADGMPLWALRTTAIPLTTNVNSYEIGTGKTVNTDKPLKVIQAWNRNVVSNVDVPMRILTKQEYSILGNKTIVTNGDQTDTVYEMLDQQHTFEEALRTRKFEPDAPNYTPRISGLMHILNGKYDFALSILKSNRGDASSCQRFTYTFDCPKAGE